jgi:hypothetical protein
MVEERWYGGGYEKRYRFFGATDVCLCRIVHAITGGGDELTEGGRFQPLVEYEDVHNLILSVQCTVYSGYECINVGPSLPPRGPIHILPGSIPP